MPERSRQHRAARWLLSVAALLWGAACPRLPTAAEEPETGPETEKRFPALQAAEGFSARLFACDPLVAFPSCMARGPKPGTLYVAHDYVKGMGTSIERPDEIRLLEDTNGDGYADTSRVVAAGFNSIQGMEEIDGALFVMHAPYLTRLIDSDNDGMPDERRDLLTGLGLPPGKNPSRLHCANGVAAGHDGWLYLALGDNGCDVERPEGDRLIFEGGGILRCRLDGTDLHLFSRGLRNIYDVALDEHLNVFVRDNENDGGDYMIRVIHSFFGADHGYPYLYRDHPGETMPPLADLARGSSAGVIVYRETQFPEPYRGSLFACEWGRAVMRSNLRVQGSGFGPVREEQFAAGHASDPYGFKPTDLVIDHDGSLFISDWADEQATRRGRGRIYHVHYAAGREVGSSGPGAPKRDHQDLEALIALLADASYSTRFRAQREMERHNAKGAAAVERALQAGRLSAVARRHAVWIMAQSHRSAGTMSRAPLLEQLAAHDADPWVRVQAVRALADLADPVLRDHRLAASGGNAELALFLAEIWPGQLPFTQREILIALGRLQWADLPGWLAAVDLTEDASLAHAAQQALRQARNWPAVLRLLDEQAEKPIRSIARRAVAEQYDAEVVRGLLDRLAVDNGSQQAAEFGVLLTRVWQKPSTWVYWGYRPAPRPPNSNAWEQSKPIAAAIERAILKIDDAELVTLLDQVERERLPLGLNALLRRLQTATTDAASARLLVQISRHEVALSAAALTDYVRDQRRGRSGRVRSLEILAALEGTAGAELLIGLVRDLEEGPVLERAIHEAGRRRVLGAIPVLVDRLAATEPAARAASARALEALEAHDAELPLARLLDDSDPSVRLAAAGAMGKLRVGAAAQRLDQLARGTDRPLAAACFRALAALNDPRALDAAGAALDEAATETAALAYLAGSGDANLAPAVLKVANRNPSVEVLNCAFTALERWANAPGLSFRQQSAFMEDAARLQARHVVAARWRVKMLADGAQAVELSEIEREAASAGKANNWRTAFLSEEGRLQVAAPQEGAAGFVAATILHFSERTSAQGELTSRGAIELFANGRPLVQIPNGGGARGFELAFGEGKTLLVARSTGPSDLWFQLALRRKADSAEHERLTAAALKQPGDAENGRRLLLNAEKTQCLKCHKLADRGELIGPELTGVGARFPRIHLIESILRPSQFVGPAYRTLSLELSDGRVVSGVVVAANETTVTVADSKGAKQTIMRSEIESEAYQTASTMPEGLEKSLSTSEFVDLVTFLAGSRQEDPAAGQPRR
jgi:putative membrane-bound dehydrogenase-like protein